MWNTLEEPWKICLEEAWKAYCDNSIPIGAVIVSTNGGVISRGRNMIACNHDEPRRLTHSKLAHAEMNAIYSASDTVYGATIYSTMEPCVMCFGAIVMNGIKEVYFGARDGLAGGTNLTNDYIEYKEIDIHEYHEFVGVAQMVLKTDFILRHMSSRAERLLAHWEPTCPIGIAIGREWFKSNRLEEYRKNNDTIDFIIDEIQTEYERNCQLS